MKMHPDWEELERFGEYGNGMLSDHVVKGFGVFVNRKKEMVGITVTSPPKEPTVDNLAIVVTYEQFECIRRILGNKDQKMTKDNIDINTLKVIEENEELLEIGREAIEKALIDFRESRIGMPCRGNGLVIRETNGQLSDIIRLGPEDALRIGLKAIADHI